MPETRLLLDGLPCYRRAMTACSVDVHRRIGVGEIARGLVRPITSQCLTGTRCEPKPLGTHSATSHNVAKCRQAGRVRRTCSVRALRRGSRRRPAARRRSAPRPSAGGQSSDDAAPHGCLRVSASNLGSVVLGRCCLRGRERLDSGVLGSVRGSAESSSPCSSGNLVRVSAASSAPSTAASCTSGAAPRASATSSPSTEPRPASGVSLGAASSGSSSASASASASSASSASLGALPRQPRPRPAAASSAPSTAASCTSGAASSASATSSPSTEPRPASSSACGVLGSSAVGFGGASFARRTPRRRRLRLPALLGVGFGLLVGNLVEPRRPPPHPRRQPRAPPARPPRPLPPRRPRPHRHRRLRLRLLGLVRHRVRFGGLLGLDVSSASSGSASSSGSPSATSSAATAASSAPSTAASCTSGAASSASAASSPSTAPTPARSPRSSSDSSPASATCLGFGEHTRRRLGDVLGSCSPSATASTSDVLVRRSDSAISASAGLRVFPSRLRRRARPLPSPRRRRRWWPRPRPVPCDLHRRRSSASSSSSAYPTSVRGSSRPFGATMM